MMTRAGAEPGSSRDSFGEQAHLLELLLREQPG